MKPYIDFNTQKRKKATSEADKNHFKLLNNAVYSKSMENMRKRIKIRVVKNSQDCIKYTSKPTCVNWKVFEKSFLVVIYEKKISLTLNKPIYVGFTVLEISNWEMYNFNYNLDHNLNYYLLTRTAYVMKFMERNHIKKCTSTKNYLI